MQGERIYMKKRFNTNIEEDKIKLLKEIAEKEGIGANDLIEKLLDQYVAKKDKCLQAPLNLDTKIQQEVIAALRREGLVLDEYEVLMIQKTRYMYKSRHFNEYGIYREESVEIDLRDLKTYKLYFVSYTKLEKLEGVEFEGLYFAENEKDRLESIDYIYNEKYDNYEKEIFINGVRIKLLETAEFDNYRREKILVYAK